MTSASGLFCSRRSRLARSSLFELGGAEEGQDPSFSPPSRILNQNNLRRHRHANPHHHSTAPLDHPRLETDGYDLPRRPPPTHLRFHALRHPSLTDRDFPLLDQAGSHYTSGNGHNSENRSTSQNRFISVGNDRLPGRVLLARERLLQRLQGVSLSASRQSNNISSSTGPDGLMVDYDFRISDFGDWENLISREYLPGTVPITNARQPEKIKRPPGLTEEAIKSLQVEIFYKSDEGDKEAMSRTLHECSICLDGFLEGNKLICLPCGHKFHCDCLETWLRICGDCPYCRTGIVLTDHRN